MAKVDVKVTLAEDFLSQLEKAAHALVDVRGALLSETKSNRLWWALVTGAYALITSTSFDHWSHVSSSPLWQVVFSILTAGGAASTTVAHLRVRKLKKRAVAVAAVKSGVTENAPTDD